MDRNHISYNLVIYETLKTKQNNPKMAKKCAQKVPFNQPCSSYNFRIIIFYINIQIIFNIFSFYYLKIIVCTNSTNFKPFTEKFEKLQIFTINTFLKYSYAHSHRYLKWHFRRKKLPLKKFVQMRFLRKVA